MTEYKSTTTDPRLQAHIFLQMEGGPCKSGEDHREAGPCHELMRWMGLTPDSTSVVLPMDSPERHDPTSAYSQLLHPTPAVVSHTPVQYDAGCVSHGMTTERHCAADGHPMPDSAVVPEWSGPSTEADDAEDHGDGYLVVPVVVPDVEPWATVPLLEWATGLVNVHRDGIKPKFRQPLAEAIAREAAIRAEGRGALDVGLLARAKFNYDNPNDHDLWDIFGEASRESLRKWARRIVAEYDLLALPASAASQGPDGGKA